MQFLVLGMHRSGTSALTRVLGLMGCHVGRDDELAAADEHNPRGYWERKDVWALDEQLLAAAGATWYDVADFDVTRLPAEARDAFATRAREVLAALDAQGTWAVKDPRLCLTLPLWRPLLRTAAAVLVWRDPLEVARSLERRDGLPLHTGLALWECYTGAALRHSAGLPRAVLSYAELCSDPLPALGRLLVALQAAGLPPETLRVPDEAALQAFLDPQLRRQRAQPGEVEEYLNATQQELWRRLRSASALQFDPAPLSPPARSALSSFAQARARAQADVQMLEGLLGQKDRYIRELETRYREDLPRLEALIAAKDRYAATLGEALEQQRRLTDAEAPALDTTTLASGATEAPEDFSNLAVATIVSRNYLSLARACCRSFLARHPGARAYVLLADTLEGVDPAHEPFELLAAADIGIPEFDDFAFKYSILELNTAVKPFFLERLFERAPNERVLYLDPDTYVYGPLLEAARALQRGQLVLTPHILSPLPADGRRPSENDLLSSGTYNLGFLGLRRTQETREFLHWWQHRLYDGAYSDPARGLFTDQKWMDLVPGLYRGVAVLRHPGYNVAYWNLHERSQLSASGAGGWQVAGQPLRFFHFSGFDRRDPARVSKHQDRFRLADLPPAFTTLFNGYAQALAEQGWAETQGLPYAYGRFDNGARVPDFARRAYARLGTQRRSFGNPFASAGDGSFFAWLTRPGPGAALPPFLHQMRELRPDLQQAFPEPDGRDRRAYLEWAAAHAGSDFGLHEPYLALIRAAHEAAGGKRDRGVPAGAQHQVSPTTSAATLAQPPEPADPPEAADPLGAARRAEALQLVESALPYGAPATRVWGRAAYLLLGPERYRRARRRVWDAYAWLARSWRLGPSRVASAASPALPAMPAARTRPRTRRPARPFGVNLFGYFDTESGVGEIARGLAAMLRCAQVPHALINVEQHWLRRGDRRVRDLSSQHPYALDVLAVNADQAPHVARQFDLQPGDGRYRVGYWFWELACLPREQAAAAALFDELWVASDFCAQAIAAATLVPTLKLVPALVAEPAGRLDRRQLSLDPDEFVFLFVFDAASVVRRKNPAALVTAFRRAFAPHEPVRLLLKTVNATPRLRLAFARLAGPARVEVRDGYVPHGELLDLVRACDAYASLHRSEGLGLTLLDALLLGKPVVATRYSGVCEFFEGPGTYPVAHRLVPLRRNHGPYPKGALWADPDVHDAALRLRQVYTEWRSPQRPPPHVGAALRERYTPSATTPALVARLELLRSRLAGPGNS